MTNDNRWEDDRYAEDSRSYRRNERSGGAYGRSFGQERHRSDGDAQTYQSGANRREAQQRGAYGSNYGGYDRSDYGESRSFNRADYDPYGANYGGSSGDIYGRGQYDAGFGDRERYGNREASGSMLHQGYQAPFGQGEQDRNDYRQYSANSNRYGQGRYGSGGYGYGSGSYDAGRYNGSRSNYDSDNGRGFWSQTRDEVASWFGDDEAARRRRMDEARDAFRGHGPKGYVRSDERIREDVNERLTDDYVLDASEIEVKVDKGEVTLDGKVASRSDKRRAEDLIEHLGGVKHVQNNLRVREQTANTYAATGGASAVPTTATADKTTGAIDKSTN